MKPKYKIGDEVYVVLKSGVDTEVHKTAVKSYEFRLTEGWYIEVEKTWGTLSSSYFMPFFGNELTKGNVLHNSNIFQTEEEAKDRAEILANELVEKKYIEDIDTAKNKVKETEQNLVKAKKELAELLSKKD